MDADEKAAKEKAKAERKAEQEEAKAAAKLARAEAKAARKDEQQVLKQARALVRVDAPLETAEGETIDDAVAITVAEIQCCESTDCQMDTTTVDVVRSDGTHVAVTVAFDAVELAV